MKTLVGWQNHWWSRRETLDRGRLGQAPAVARDQEDGGHDHHHCHDHHGYDL